MLDAMEMGRHWWAFALRGVAAIIFGILAFVWPGMTLAVLVILWGVYALIDGIAAIGAFLRTSHDHRWGLLVEGIVGILAGIATFVWPALTALVLLYIIAVWAIVTGVLELFEAVRLRRAVQNEFWLVLGGLASLIFGIILLVAPGAGALAVIWLIGAYAIIFGLLLLALALRLYTTSHHRGPALGTT